eukprot:1829586-Prymnesium_polylepis.1
MPGRRVAADVRRVVELLRQRVPRVVHHAAKVVVEPRLLIHVEAELFLAGVTHQRGVDARHRRHVHPKHARVVNGPCPLAPAGEEAHA